jgi:hypothetical protein
MVKKFSLHLCPKVVLPFKRQFSKEVLLELVEKTKQLYVLLTLAYCYSIIASSNLWMSEGAYDIFALVIHFWGIDW